MFALRLFIHANEIVIVFFCIAIKKKKIQHLTCCRYNTLPVSTRKPTAGLVFQYET